MDLNPRQHRETVHSRWQHGFAGAGEVEVGDGTIAIAAPASVGGSGRGTQPSALLVAAANACYLLTLAAVLELHGVPATHIELTTEAVFRGSQPPELYAMVHRPTVTLGRPMTSDVDTIGIHANNAKDACVATRAMPNVIFDVDPVRLVAAPSSEPVASGQATVATPERRSQ